MKLPEIIKKLVIESLLSSKLNKVKTMTYKMRKMLKVATLGVNKKMKKTIQTLIKN